MSKTKLTPFQRAERRAAHIIASGKSPSATKKGSGRTHCQGYGYAVKESFGTVAGFRQASNVRPY